MQSRKTSIWLKVVEYFMLVAAYTFLIYKLAAFDNYAQLAEHFRQAGWLQYVYLSAVAVLLFANVGVETYKWHYLLRNLEHHSFAVSLRGVLVGWMAAFFTPNRLGEFPGRSLRLLPENRVSGIALGAVGSLAQTLVIVGCGLPACVAFFRLTTLTDHPQAVLWSYVGIFIFLSAFCLLIPTVSRKMAGKCWKNDRLQLMFETVGMFSASRFGLVCLLSLLRYLIFCTQFAFTLAFCGVELPLLELLVAVPTYYLFVTFTPSISIAEAAVRGSWAMIVFSAFTPNTAAVALAAVLLWMVNSVLPMLVGSMLKKE